MQHNPNILSRSTTGLGLVGIGMFGDLLSGFLALGHYLGAGLLVHLGAVLVWAIGLLLLDKPDKLLSTMLGSILFPGIGIFAWSLAGFISGLSRHKKKTMDDEEDNQIDLLAEIHAAIEMPFETSLRPIVDVRQGSDSRIKRAALDLICREPSLNAMALARGFLSDLDPDVRALAAVAVSGLESHMSELVKSALGQIKIQPMSAESHASMGHVCLECANQSGNDSMNRHFYLTQACQAFEDAIRLDPTRDNDRIALTEALIGLREYPKAWDALAEVLAAGTQESKIYRLGLETAFRERRFDRVVELVKQASEVLSENDGVFPILRWWLAFEVTKLQGLV